jgi:transcriptional regulator with XRE-family HTH domain
MDKRMAVIVLQKGMTQKEIAEKMGVTVIKFEPEPISAYWDHNTKPSMFIVKRGGKEIHRGTFSQGRKLL